MLGVQMVLGCIDVMGEYLIRHHKVLTTLVKLTEKLGMQKFNVVMRCGSQGYSTSVSMVAQPGVSACLRPPLCPTFRTPVFGVEDKESHAEGPDLALFIHPLVRCRYTYPLTVPTHAYS